MLLRVESGRVSAIESRDAHAPNHRTPSHPTTPCWQRIALRDAPCSFSQERGSSVAIPLQLPLPTAISCSPASSRKEGRRHPAQTTGGSASTNLYLHTHCTKSLRVEPHPFTTRPSFDRSIHRSFTHLTANDTLRTCRIIKRRWGGGLKLARNA